MAAGAASLFALAQDRPAGVTRLRLLPPGPGQGAHAVAEIVTDDMPFLVDSVLGALARQGRVVRQLLHPVVAVRRDPAGRLLALGDAPGAVLESMMRITLDAAPAAMLPGTAAAAPEDWPALQEALAQGPGRYPHRGRRLPRHGRGAAPGRGGGDAAGGGARRGGVPALARRG